MHNPYKQTLSLNGKWLVKDFEPGEGERLKVYLTDYSPQGWLKAQVPGVVHFDLLKAKKIKDPFFGQNAEECTWVEERDWWYRKEFFISPKFKNKKIKLIFEGLDTFATIWLNGYRIGEHQSMFISYEVKVSRYLKIKEKNVLVVKLASPLKAVASQMDKARKLKTANRTYERLYARKSQMSYGWDIAPRLVTAGIWRSVWLVPQASISIEDIFVKPVEVTKNNAKIELNITFQSYLKQNHLIELKLEAECQESKARQALTLEISPGRTNKALVLEIDKPKLWWTWDIGMPNLYKLKIKLYSKEQLWDTYYTTFGLREIELVQEKQTDGGISFTFCLNKEKLFVRGINWTPADSIFNRITRRKYERLVKLAKEANINMFRVWGGGIIEDKLFYDLCDREGILIWQDFPYACAEYPKDSDFLSLAKEEAEKIVRKLRNHPSIALWCGDNENEWLYGYLHPLQKRVLKEVCASLDPTRPYWPSSPDGGKDPNDPWQGDTHNWHHGTFYKSHFYSEDKSRFVSEIGHISLPNLSTLKKFLPKEDIVWPPYSPLWDYHTGTVTHQKRNRLLYMRRAITACGFTSPQRIEEAIKITQLIQGMAHKYWIEYYRRRKFFCSGILLWNMSDAWPQISDAITDYYLNLKIAYFYTKRAYRPVIVSLNKKKSKNIQIWLINDTLRSLKGKMKLRCIHFTKGSLKEMEIEVKVEANSANMIQEVDLRKWNIEKENQGCLWVSFFNDDGQKIAENNYFFVEVSELSLPDTILNTSVVPGKWKGEEITWEIRISAQNYARVVELSSSENNIEFSDNYFDIPPAEERKIKVRMETKETEEKKAISSLRIQIKAWNSKKINQVLLPIVF